MFLYVWLTVQVFGSYKGSNGRRRVGHVESPSRVGMTKAPLDHSIDCGLVSVDGTVFQTRAPARATDGVSGGKSR